MNDFSKYTRKELISKINNCHREQVQCEEVNSKLNDEIQAYQTDKDKAIQKAEDLKALLDSAINCQKELFSKRDDLKRKVADLRQQLTSSEASNARLRKALEFIQEEAKEWYAKDGRIRYVAHQVLSTTPAEATQKVQGLVKSAELIAEDQSHGTEAWARSMARKPLPHTGDWMVTNNARELDRGNPRICANWNDYWLTYKQNGVE